MLKWLKSYWLDPEFEEKRNFLRRVPFFRHIPRKEYGRLFQALVKRHYEAGDVLFKEGDVGRALFILEWGQIEILRKNAAGKPMRLALLDSGDYFGEISLLDDQPRTASAVAVTPSRVYLLYRTELESLLEYAPHAGAAIMAHLAEVLASRLRSVLASSDRKGLEALPAIPPVIKEVR
jgi:CRP/FNR family cyclic AMP-dependent transcriptional regulator